MTSPRLALRRRRGRAARGGGHLPGRAERGADEGAARPRAELHVPDGGQPHDEAHHQLALQK